VTTLSAHIFNGVTNYCIGLPASICHIDVGYHLLPYNLMSSAVPLFTVA